MTTFQASNATLACMKTLIVLALTSVTIVVALGCGSYSTLPDFDGVAALDCSGRISLTLDQLTRDAVGTDKGKAEDAIRTLRARGPEGLRALLETNAAILKQRATANPLIARGQNDDFWSRIRSALDGVSGQRDCSASHLYWYTDFEQAKAAAITEAKPILSLRLLGKLDEEFSCANSRFFRTTLYANAGVSQYLRDHFVLHWKSVRPVPRVTIDFGDGRKLERTLTGNSIHYVLAADGRVIDALPGLYGPGAFLRGLQQAERITQRSASVEAGKREVMLGEYHRARIASLTTELEADLQKVSAASLTLLSAATIAPVSFGSALPTAQMAARITASKSLVERPILNNALPRSAQNEITPTGIDDATWTTIAALHAETAKLDESSKALMLAMNPTASAAGRETASKRFVEDPLLRQIRNLERSISEDTVRNEYLLHPQIHAWLASGEMTNVDELNRKVYAELFLTPDTDPWLGLAPSDTFTALDNNGVAQVRGDSSKTATATSLGL